jgi:hypothetical protein
MQKNWYDIHYYSSPQTLYIRGFDMGWMMPCLSNTLGLVESWKVSFVVHSGPTGTLKLLSYCALFSNGCGRALARYFEF